MTRSLTIEEALAENKQADRGDANIYRYVQYGDSSIGQDVEHLVVSNQYTFLDLVTGEGYAIAYCFSKEAAQMIVDALNARES